MILLPLRYPRLLLATLLVSALSPAVAKVNAEVYKESPGVAAHFPVPKAVDFTTPAFAQGKKDFTSQQEMEQFIHELAASSPELQVNVIAQSQEGRAIPLLIFSSEGYASPQWLMKNGKPTVLIVAQQHGNEPAGGEAALMFAQRLAEGKMGNVLSRVNVLIIPRANPDGAERFTRDLANGVNLNRDHLLLVSPESRAITQVLNRYQPDVILDAHEFSVAGRWVKKFNAVQGYDGLVQHATTPNLPQELYQSMAGRWNAVFSQAFKANDLRDSVYYTTDQIKLDDKTLSMGGTTPDSLRNVAGLRNSIGFLLETRGVGIGKAHFERRVWTHFVAMRAMVQEAASDPQALLALTRDVRRTVTASDGKGELVVKGAATKGKHDVTLLNAENGEPMTFEADWRSSLQITPVITRSRPWGYLLGPDQQAAVDKLRALGIEVYRLKRSQTLPVERYNIASLRQGHKFDVTGKIGATGNMMTEVETTLVKMQLTDTAGYWYVPLSQPLANLVVAALEPETQSSFVANGLITLPGGGEKVGNLPLWRVMRKISDLF
ncbi:M14 family metallocarboxypeptidase [Enterobacter hormaechei]|uniref:M14 family metallopeptidase n=1 Tax=Enterobacter hormaechei TaxID=158836 RepID=UPI00263A909E|nr:M14 family metallocarboxypeptidase [Enterobacter hormaechei]MDN4979448.1 M14 family metallocarboxypeptidase [Enterobacter hormaechei]